MLLYIEVKEITSYIEYYLVGITISNLYCMEMNENELHEFKSILTKMLFDFDQLCKKNHLEYCVTGGTTIGVLRHKGFIPWDDDIDVFMPRSDYNRLIGMGKDMKGSSYEIINYDTEGYYLPFAKFSNRNTTLWEFKDEPCIYGAYIDIFPLDETNLDVQLSYRKKLNHYFIHYRKAKEKNTFRKAFEYFKRGNMKMGLIYIRFSTIDILLAKYYFRKFHVLENFLSNEIKGDYFASYYGAYTNEMYPKSMIFPAKEGVFEGLTVKIPADADAFCSQLYGDYMLLPPKEKRITHHEHYYYNLRQRLSFDQIREIKRD